MHSNTNIIFFLGGFSSSQEKSFMIANNDFTSKTSLSSIYNIVDNNVQIFLRQ